MPSCSVKWCSNHTSTCSLKSLNGVSFHRFPKDEATCQKWVEAVRHERRDPWWTSSNASRICSIHFKETDISSTPCKVNILSKTAVPVCTMVWYDKNENNTTSKTFNVRTNTDKPILKTYERKKSNMNVLKELKVNMSYNRNIEDTAMSQTNSFVISNKTPCLSQDNLPQATKLFNTLQVSRTLNLKDGQESDSIANISSKTSVSANVTEAQNITILNESNKKEYVKSCMEKCCKSKILVKLNDNTNLILDEDWSNDDIKFRYSNKVSKEVNSRTFENSRNVTLKHFKSNENKKPNEVTYNISKADMFVKTITSGNVELNANVSKSYVGKMLRTYLPKRKDTTCGNNIRDTSKLLEKNKSLRSITMEKGLNTIKCKEDNNTNVNKYPKCDFSNKIRVCYKNNIIADLQSKKKPQEKKQRKLLNLKKYTFKKTSNFFNIPIIREKKTVGVDPNIDANKEANIAHIDEFINNQSRNEKIKATDTAVYDEIISELFENSKKSNSNISNLPSKNNYQVSNENICTDHNMDKGTKNRNVILDLDTNIYTEINTLMDLELSRVENSGLNSENVEDNINKRAINERFAEFKVNKMSESDQPMVISNKNMYSNENITNNATLLPSNELQNLESNVVRNIFPETKKEKFTVLKKYLSMKPKLDSPSELCTNVLTLVNNNIFSRYDNISSTSLTKENLQVSNRDHNAELNKNVDIDVNDMVTSLQSNINTDTTKETATNVTSSKELNPILFKEFINNIVPELNKSEKMDFITNFNEDPNPIRDLELNKRDISDINVECKKNIGKDMPDLDTFMDLESCSEINIGLNEMNTDNTGTNAYFRDYNENTATDSNQNLSMEHGDHLIPISIESDYHFLTEINVYNTTQFNKNMCYDENITNNAKIISNNELQNLETSISNVVTETKKDNITELKKHLLVISSQNDMNTDVNKETESMLLEELITNTIPELNNSEDLNFINNSKTDRNTTRPTLNNTKISDITQCNNHLENGMPELNKVILSELNENQAIKSREVINSKINHLNTEIYTDKELLFRKAKKDFVMATSDDQHTVVNEHMDVVDSILNRDIAAEFDLSLLLSDTPISDEEIQNLDNNSNNNSLDGIVGSPNWIQLSTGEMPKIIDDILDHGSPFFENLDLFDKTNKLEINKEPNIKNNEIKQLIKEKCSTSNFEQFKEQIINNYCENGKQCTNNSIEQIEKQVIAEISDYDETSLKLRNNICSENKDSQSEKVMAEKCYNLFEEQTDKQILKQYFQSNNGQCEKFNLDQSVDKCYENRGKEIGIGNNTRNQYQQNNVDSKANQIEEPTSNHYFEQSENLHRDPDGLDGIDNTNDLATFGPSKKPSDKQSNEQKNQSCIARHITIEESIPKSKNHSQGTVETNKQNSKLFKDCNEKRIKEVNNVSNEVHTVGTESVSELNVGQLKRAIFEECYDPECGNECKNQIHNSNIESHKKDDEQYKKQPDYTPHQPGIEKQKRRYDFLYKQQCYQSSTDNFKKQLNSSSDPNTNAMNNKSVSERHKLSHNEKYKTKYKKIAIDHIPGQYLELRWKESERKSNSLSQEGCKRKHKDLGLNQRKMLCSQSTNIFSQQLMAECPECGYTTDDNDLMNYKSDVDLTITKPLSLINKDMLISLHDIENKNKGTNNSVALESVYAMELAYVTAIQALERKLKQKIAISEYRLRRVNNLSQINNQLTNVNITLLDFLNRNKV